MKFLSLVWSAAVAFSVLESLAAVKVRFGTQTVFYDFAVGSKVFSDRGYGIAEVPARAQRTRFASLPIDGWSGEVVFGGELRVLTPVSVEHGGMKGSASQDEELGKLGFTVVAEVKPFLLFKGEINRVRAWRKEVRPGEKLRFGKFVVPYGLDEYDPTEDVVEPVNVDLGRQLLLNDRLIAERSAKRVWHKPVKYAGNPVLKPETELELGGKNKVNPMAAPFSGGVWYDGQDGLYKCWYHAGWANGEAYAWSKDGIRWTRPKLNEDGGNLVFRSHGLADSSAIILDPDASDGWRWKAFSFDCGRIGGSGGMVFVSKDGISWSDPVPTAVCGDRSTIFYNPFSKKWGYSIRSGRGGYGRSRDYSESSDFLSGAKEFPNRRPWIEQAAGGRSVNGEELYNFDCVAYESVMIGLAMVMNPPPNAYWSLKGVPKMVDLRFGFNVDPENPDGWRFPQKDIDDGFFIEQTRQYGTWDMGYLQSAGGICLVVGDELRFYYGGFAGDVGKKNNKQSNYTSGMYARASMGFATLRRDGFCSLEDGDAVTRQLVFAKGDRLWLNVDATKGSVGVIAETADGRQLGACRIQEVDSTHYEAFKLPADCPFRLRFSVGGGARLYSFWTSDAKGRSGGYLAGGSPSSRTLRDE